jgi:hypothetical protein
MIYTLMAMAKSTTTIILFMLPGLTHDDCVMKGKLFNETYSVGHGYVSTFECEADK